MKPSYIVGILFLLLIFYAASNEVWVNKGPSLYGRDVVGHLQLVEKFYYRICDVARGGGSAPAKAAGILSLLHEDSLPFHGTYMWPKLVHLSAAVPCFVFGLRHEVIIQFNILFLGILMASVYSIGKKCHSPAAGLFAAVLASLYPAIWGQSRKFGLDFPVTAMTSLAVAVLIRTNHFRDGRHSFWLGVALGLGILTKGQIVLYLGGPLLVDLCMGLGRGRADRRARIFNFAAAMLLALLISLPWWRGIALDLWRAYFGTVTDYPFSWAYAYQRQAPFSARWLLFHLVHGFISISLLYAFLFALSLPAYVRSRSDHKIIISSWVLAAYAVWTISNIKRDTDFYPCLPALALITAIGVMSWERPLLRRAAVLGSISLGLAQYFSVSFSSEGYAVWTAPNPYGKPCEPDGYNTPFQPPYPNNYREVMQDISRRIKSGGPDAKYERIGVIETSGSERWSEYSTIILEYYFRLDHPGAFIYPSRHTPQAFLEHCQSFKYLIVMDKRNGDAPDWTEVEGFFADERWKRCIADDYGGVRDFYGVIDSFRDYRLLSRTTLMPEGIGIFLLEKGPLAIPEAGAEIPASRYSLSNLATSPRSIGADGVPRHGFWEPDYDLFFPHWLDHPLADKDLRCPGDPYFCEYDLEFAQGGDFRLYGEFHAARECSISVYCDGKALAEGLGLRPQGAGARRDWAWISIGTVSLAPGRHRIRFEGKDDFPDFRALRFSKLT